MKALFPDEIFGRKVVWDFIVFNLIFIRLFCWGGGEKGYKE